MNLAYSLCEVSTTGSSAAGIDEEEDILVSSFEYEEPIDLCDRKQEGVYL